MTPILKRFGEIPVLLFCLALWVALFSLALLVFGKLSYLPGFLFGSACSLLYVYLLYRRVNAWLTLPAEWIAAPPKKGRLGRLRSGVLKYMRSGWIKTMQPIAIAVIIILLVSHYFQAISFLPALFGFFSFQISLFLYAILISIDQIL